jgi:hypothetical protein
MVGLRECASAGFENLATWGQAPKSIAPANGLGRMRASDRTEGRRERAGGLLAAFGPVAAGGVSKSMPWATDLGAVGAPEMVFTRQPSFRESKRTHSVENVTIRPETHATRPRAAAFTLKAIPIIPENQCGSGPRGSLKSRQSFPKPAPRLRRAGFAENAAILPETPPVPLKPLPMIPEMHCSSARRASVKMLRSFPKSRPSLLPATRSRLRLPQSGSRLPQSKASAGGGCCALHDWGRFP